MIVAAKKTKLVTLEKMLEKRRASSLGLIFGVRQLMVVITWAIIINKNDRFVHKAR